MLNQTPCHYIVFLTKHLIFGTHGGLVCINKSSFSANQLSSRLTKTLKESLCSKADAVTAGAAPPTSPAEDHIPTDGLRRLSERRGQSLEQHDVDDRLHLPGETKSTRDSMTRDPESTWISCVLVIGTQTVFTGSGPGFNLERPVETSREATHSVITR